MSKRKDDATNRAMAEKLPLRALPPAPSEPYKFHELVGVIKANPAYGLAIHAIVKFCRKHPDPGDQAGQTARAELFRHVQEKLTQAELDDLYITKQPGVTGDDDRCSNNTKLHMLAFLKYSDESPHPRD